MSSTYPMARAPRRATTREEQQREGVGIAREMAREVVRNPGTAGVYLFPPFGKYEMVLDVLAAM